MTQEHLWDILRQIGPLGTEHDAEVAWQAAESWYRRTPYGESWAWYESERAVDQALPSLVGYDSGKVRHRILLRYAVGLLFDTHTHDEELEFTRWRLQMLLQRGARRPVATTHIVDGGEPTS